MQDGTSQIPAILKEHEAAILKDWLAEQQSATTSRLDTMQEAERVRQSKELLSLLRVATQSGNLTDISTKDWEPIRELLADVSRTRAR